MSIIKIDASERSPSICFDFEKNLFSISGESYPEDTTAFYSETISRFQQHIASQEAQEIRFDFQLIYFNSSSAKILMSIFDLLDEAGAKNKVVINWLHDSDDDNMMELGEEFGEDLENATFNLVAQ